MPIHAAPALLLAACAGAIMGCLPPLQHAEAASAAAPNAAVHELLSRDLNGVAGKELRMLTVEYVPGGASPAHLVFTVKDKAAPVSTALPPEHGP